VLNISRSRRHPIRGRLLAGGLLVAVIGAAAAPAAVAAPSARASSISLARAGQLTSGAPAPGQISWSVTPASIAAPDARAIFAYGGIKPGASISDHVAVLNRSSQSVAFSIYATDASGTAATGALTLLPVNQKPTDIGSWITFPGHGAQMSIIIPADKGVIEPFTLAVPSRATPGDHTGGMIASVGVPQRNSSGQLVTLYQRIAVPIELRVTGALHAALQVESVSASFGNPVNPFGGGSASVTYSVVNTGNVKLTGTQLVTITGPFGAKSTIHPATLPTVLPGDSIRYTVSAGGLFPAGSIGAHVTITPRWPANTSPLPTALVSATGSTSVFAVPWALIVLIVLLIGGGYGWWRMRKSRRLAHLAEVALAAEQARRETERRLLGGTNGKSASTVALPSGVTEADSAAAGSMPE
jgi:hypothetical protein